MAVDTPAPSFPGMNTTEQFRFYFHQHVMRLWVPTGIMLFWMAVAAVLTYVSGVMDMEDTAMRRAIIILLALCVFIPQMAFIVRVYNYYMRLVVVTDQKIHIFKRTLMTTDRHESVDLASLLDIDRKQQSVVQNMLGFGTLKLEGPHAQLRLHFTPKIDAVYSKIVSLREEARRRMVPGNQLPTVQKSNN